MQRLEKFQVKGPMKYCFAVNIAVVRGDKERP